jgi:hypothetical protein
MTATIADSISIAATITTLVLPFFAGTIVCAIAVADGVGV